MPQPLLTWCAGADASGANILLCLDSKIHSALANKLPKSRPKRTFLCCCNNNFRILGGSHLNCARWLWVEGRGEYSHDGGCGWLAPGDVRMYWLPQLQGLPPAMPPATCTSRQAQPGVGYNACIATHHRPPAPLVAGAVRGRSGGAPGCWGGSNRTPGAPVAPPTTQTTAPQESARKMLLISCML